MPNSWQIIPKTQVNKIPHNIYPLTPLINMITIEITPIIHKITPTPCDENVPFAIPFVNEYKLTSVAPSTMICAFCTPMNAMKKPIPTDTATFNCTGIALKIASRTLVSDMMIKIIPSTSTAVNATCQG